MHLRPRGSALTLHFLPCDCLIRPGLLISSERRELRINFALPFKAAAFLQLSNLASKATGDQSGGCGAQVRMRTRRAVGSRVACPESRLETTTPSRLPHFQLSRSSSCRPQSSRCTRMSSTRCLMSTTTSRPSRVRPPASLPPSRTPNVIGPCNQPTDLANVCVRFLHRFQDCESRPRRSSTRS